MLRFCACVFVLINSFQPSLGANHRWISLTGDFSSPDSWSTGKAPSEWLPGDRVILDLGSNNVTTGLDQSAVRIADLLVTDGFEGRIGSFGAMLRIDADQARFFGQQSEIHYAPPDSPRLRIVIVDGPFVELNGYVSQLFAKSGVVQAYGVYDTVVASSGFPTAMVHLYPGPSVPRLRVKGALCVNYREIASGHEVTVASGQLDQHGQFRNGSSLALHAGVLYYMAGLNDPVEIRMELLGGLLDLSQSYHELSATIGYVTPSGWVVPGPLQTESDLGLLNMNDLFPDASPFDRSDIDADGLEAAIDPCPESAGQNGDLNGDCASDLLDYRVLQESFTGPN